MRIVIIFICLNQILIIMNYKYLTIALFIIVLLLGLIYFTIPDSSETMKNLKTNNNTNILCNDSGCYNSEYNKYIIENFDAHSEDDVDEVDDSDKVNKGDYKDIQKESNKNNIDLGTQVQDAINKEIVDGEDEVINNEFEKEKQEKEYGKDVAENNVIHLPRRALWR